MRRAVSFLLLWLFFSLVWFGTVKLVFSQGHYGNVVVARVVSVYDGDTFRADIDSWPEIAGKSIGIRVSGVDTPEMRDKDPRVRLLAMRAKLFTTDTLRRAGVIELRNIKRGKYFRIVADVYVDGRSLSRMLIKRGYARHYDGRTKRGEWQSDK